MIQNKILELLKQNAIENPHEYVNPHFLLDITNKLFEYYELEDDLVNNYITDMWEL